MLGTRHFKAPGDHAAASLPGTGVLLVNLGTPDAPTVTALRPYLEEFLSDPRVIEYPRWLWQIILHGVILTTRPARSARAYQRIWMPEGSPLRVYSEALTTAIGTELAHRERPVKVVLAMSYGHPRIGDAIAALQREGVGRLLVVPLYPQYSATSTGSVIDAVADALKALRWPPEVTIVNHYHDDAGYLDALAASVREHWQAHGRGERLLMSFHGIPQRYARAGDPYPLQCEATAQALRARLDLDASDAPMSFQSRLGREPWLMPYTDATVRELAAAGVKRIDVICPGFAVDCLETLEEIAMQNRDFFIAAGGKTLHYIPALNQRRDHVGALCDLIEARLPRRVTSQPSR